MGKSQKKAHFENGLISDMRDSARNADREMVKKAVKESKKAKAKGKTVFSKLSRKETKKLLSYC